MVFQLFFNFAFQKKLANNYPSTIWFFNLLFQFFGAEKIKKQLKNHMAQGFLFFKFPKKSIFWAHLCTEKLYNQIAKNIAKCLGEGSYGTAALLTTGLL